MSTVVYRHNQSYNFKKNGIKHVIKEDIVVSFSNYFKASSKDSKDSNSPIHYWS